MRRGLAGLLLVGALGAAGCADLPYPVRPLVVRTTQTHGAAVTLSRDNTLAVATNRTANSVSVFRVALGDTPSATRVGPPIPTPDGEPWAAVIGGDDDTAYVILRHAGEVLEITGLRTRPTPGRCVRTGAEPTGIAISPRGARLYVSNQAEGTVTEVLTASMTVSRTIDLNAPLAASGMLGAPAQIGAAPGPGFAHPRAVVVTNDRDADDADETVYVTEFFSQQRADGAVTEEDARADRGRQGVVYRFGVGSGRVEPLITLAPVPDTGFPDAQGRPTSCFPNQLYAAAVREGRLYVTSVCASPRGPVGPVVGPAPGAAVDGRNFTTNLHAAVFVVDTRMNREIVAEHLVLTDKFMRRYEGTVADGGVFVPDQRHRLPLIPNDIAFVPDDTRYVAYISSYGSDAVFRVAYMQSGAFREVGADQADFIDLGGASAGPGHLPIGIAVANAQRMLALNEGTLNLQVVDLNQQVVTAAARSVDAPTDTAVARGRRAFVTGLGRWSYRGQAWSSCESCHPDGLSDNVTWVFPSGPRQTPSLAGTFGPDPAAPPRILNWSASADEVHDFELTVRDVSGGVGAIVHRRDDGRGVIADADRVHFDLSTPAPIGAMAVASHAGLDGSTRSLMPPRSTLDDWESIDAYVRSVRAPEAPRGLSRDDVASGRAVFVEYNCGGCHGGPGWTISRRFYDPGEANRTATETLRTTRYCLPAGFLASLNPPADPARHAPLRAAAAAPDGDQVNCVLRAVGTFPPALDSERRGVAPPGVYVREARANADAAARGATGYNPPSLVGLAAGAPYFHAGNARTLEESLSGTFARHANAFATNFVSSDQVVPPEQIRHLIAFLRSIDDRTTPVPVPALAGNANPDFCACRPP